MQRLKGTVEPAWVWLKVKSSSFIVFFSLFVASLIPQQINKQHFFEEIDKSSPYTYVNTCGSSRNFLAGSFFLTYFSPLRSHCEHLETRREMHPVGLQYYLTFPRISLRHFSCCQESLKFSWDIPKGLQ
jgi:hypothetical protein